MKRRRLLILAGVVLAVFVAAWAVRAFLGVGRGRYFDREHYRQIRKGMTQAEVEALVGAPPGDYRGRVTRYQSRDVPAEFPAQARRADWFGDDGYLEVAFDPDAGTVVAARFMEPAPPSSVAEWVQDWLQSLWP